MDDPEMLRFVRMYYRITDIQTWQGLRGLASVLAGSEAD
jgi:hypothetical protein